MDSHLCLLILSRNTRHDCLQNYSDRLLSTDLSKEEAREGHVLPSPYLK